MIRRSASQPRPVLDIQAVQTKFAPERGLARYVTHLSKELLNRPDLVHSLCLNPTRPFPKNLNPDLLYCDRLTWGGAPTLRSAMRNGPPVYWIMSPFDEEAKYDTLIPRAIVAGHSRLVVTLYDLIPFLHPDIYLESAVKRARYANSIEIVKMADLVFCISNSTRNDAVRHLGLARERTIVIGTGVPEFFNPDDGKELDAGILRALYPQLLRRPFLFTVLGKDPRKNLGRLLEAYSQLPESTRSQYSLAIAGTYPKGMPEDILAGCDPQIAKNILFTRQVSDTCLRALYRSCALFVFPSEYEGFGLPLAEALAAGSPAIASQTSSLTEILDDPAALFNPHNPAEISVSIERALTDADTNRRLREFASRKRGEHSWAGVAERVVQALHRLSPRTPTRSNPSRPAIALVGPFPPQRTGIADNNFAIARELANLADLFLFYSGDCDVARLRELQPSGCLPVSDLGKHFAPQYLDAVIYTFGNSAHHVETLDKILKYPGLLWLHDVHVADLYDSYRTRAGLTRGEYITDTARKMYGERSPPPVTGINPFEMEELRCWGLHFTQEIVSKSRGVIVSSHHSLHMLALDQHPFSSLPPSWVVPLASPVSNQSERKVTRRVGSPAVVSSFGFLGEPKAPDLLIAAVARLPPELAVQLRFVGYGGSEYCESLLSHARMLGIEQSVQITGYVNKSEWFEYVHQSTCAVQLRRHSNGESSAAVLDCVSLGLPTITNIPSTREMPADTVLHVSPDVSVSDLTDRLLTLLTDPAEWRRFHEGALRYSASNNIRIAAQKILAAVMELSNRTAA